MPDPSSLDIAQLDNWYGFRLGMTRAQVKERMQALAIEAHDYGEDNLATTVNEHGIEFYFVMDGSERLRQLSVDSDQVYWNGQPLIEVRLDDALRALEPFGRTPMWEAHDVIGEAFPVAGELPADPVSDEKLMEEGTVWLPERGLGMVICEGEVIGLAWREERDLPTRYAGPLTEAQRQLSKRPDIEEYLREKRMARHAAATPKNPLAPLSAVLVLVCLAALAVIARRGFQEMQLWNKAAILEGQLVSMEEVPRKKFFDLGPEVLRQSMPDDPTRHRDLYHIAYLDPAGHPQTTTLEGAEFYVPPRVVGETVQVAYVPGNPPRVKGPSRARDAAFIEYLPWAMAVGVFYLIGQFAISYLPGLLRRATQAIVPKRSTTDSDRPELR